MSILWYRTGNFDRRRLPSQLPCPAFSEWPDDSVEFWIQQTRLALYDSLPDLESWNNGGHDSLDIILRWVCDLSYPLLSHVCHVNTWEYAPSAYLKDWDTRLKWLCYAMQKPNPLCHLSEKLKNSLSGNLPESTSFLWDRSPRKADSILGYLTWQNLAKSDFGSLERKLFGVTCICSVNLSRKRSFNLLFSGKDLSSRPVIWRP